MAENRPKFHFDLSIDMTLSELDKELSASYGDPVKSRILEAARAHGLVAAMEKDEAPDGGTHFDIPHIDQG